MAVGTAGGLVDRAGRLPGLKRVLLVDSAAAAVGATTDVAASSWALATSSREGLKRSTC